jgi:membrane protease YdiL (CAAX protease family)
VATLAPIGRLSQELFQGVLGPHYGSEVLWWMLTLGLFAYVRLVERRSWSSIGFCRPTRMDIALAVLTAILMLAGTMVIYNVIFPAFNLAINMKHVQALMRTSFTYRLVLVVRAAVAEETLFRGYPIERLLECRVGRGLAAFIPWAAFTYAHLASWGAAQLIVAGYGGLLLAILYLWRRNLWANMLAHFIADGAGFLT